MSIDTPVLPPSPGVRAKTGMPRVGLGLLAGNIGALLPLNAASAVLLPARIADLAPDNKVALLGLATGLAAVTGLLAAIVAGALSDRTRSRFGSRTPWILLGAVLSSAGFFGLSFANDIVTIFVLWGLIPVALNCMIAPLAAIIADRVPSHRRATLSSVSGLGLMLATALGPLLAAQFVDDQAAGFRVLALVALAVPLLAVIVAPDHDNRTIPRERWSAQEAKRAFAFPRNAPDFYWALWGRLILVSGYFMVATYQLYILVDYIHLEESKAVTVVGTNSLIFAVTALASMALGGLLSDRLGRRKPLVFGASIFFLGAIVSPLVFPTIGGMIAFAVIGGLGFGMYYSTDSALMTEVLPDPETRGKDLAILNVANTGGQAVAPLITSGVVAIGAGFGPVFLVALVTCGVGALCVLPIRSVR